MDCSFPYDNVFSAGMRLRMRGDMPPLPHMSSCFVKIKTLLFYIHCIFDSCHSSIQTDSVTPVDPRSQPLSFWILGRGEGVGLVRISAARPPC